MQFHILAGEETGCEISDRKKSQENRNERRNIIKFARVTARDKIKRSQIRYTY